MMRNSRTRTVTLLCLVILAVSTGCDSPSLESGILDLTLTQLQAAPERVEMGDQSLILGASAWRDFMPILPQPDSPLLAVLVEVIEKNRETISPSIALNYLWVVQEDEIWSYVFSEEDKTEAPGYMIRSFASGGPKWDCGSPVDIIVGLSDQTGDLTLLKAARDQIECPQ